MIRGGYNTPWANWTPDKKQSERAQGCERQTPLNVRAGLTELHPEQLGMTFQKIDFLSSVLFESIFRTQPWSTAYWKLVGHSQFP